MLIISQEESMSVNASMPHAPYVVIQYILEKEAVRKMFVESYIVDLLIT